jgi:hypothetical protein
VEACQSVWSAAEWDVVQQAIDKAYARELAGLIQSLQARIIDLAGPDDVWSLHDFLSAKRHEMDGRYDRREASLLFVFADLVKDGLLKVEELDGLDHEKIVKISALARM